MPRIKVIDLSHHNTLSDLRPAWDAGVRGVIHKATEGSSFTDDMIGARATLAKSAGMLFGAYHFLRAGDMNQQAEFFVEYTLAETEGIYPPEEVLFAADHEDHGVSLASLKTFLSKVRQLTGKVPIIYSGNVLKEQLQLADDEIGDYPLWLAQYSSTPVLPAGFSKYFLWQYTDGNAGPSPKSVPGVNPPVDCNDYQGDDAQLANEWINSGFVVGSGTPVGPEPPIRIDISAFAIALSVEEDSSYTITVPKGTKVKIVEV
jgi:lysozyme